MEINSGKFFKEAIHEVMVQACVYNLLELRMTETKIEIGPTHNTETRQNEMQKIVENIQATRKQY